MKDMHLLGLKVIDEVTGFAGVCTSVGYDLYGCIQAVVTPPAKESGELEDSRWFDTKRLRVQDEDPVMAVPDFCVASPAKVAGPQEKPARRDW